MIQTRGPTPSEAGGAELSARGVLGFTLMPVYGEDLILWMTISDWDLRRRA